tara:strand:+ start:236 stop:424 length:189 start_codon:yes stop_codon:yes gene_type:complete
MSLTKRWAEKIGYFEKQQYPQDEAEYEEYLKNKNEKDSTIDRQDSSVHNLKDKGKADSTEVS